MKSFNDTEMRDPQIERRIPARKRMVTALPKKDHQISMAAHAIMMSMINAGFTYDAVNRAWVKRTGS